MSGRERMSVQESKRRKNARKAEQVRGHRGPKNSFSDWESSLWKKRTPSPAALRAAERSWTAQGLSALTPVFGKKIRFKYPKDPEAREDAKEDR